MKKTYVLDTNVLMHYPDAFFDFEDNDVVIPAVVVEELDNHKRDPGEDGYNVRQALRTLKEFYRNRLQTNQKFDAVPLRNGGTVRIENDKLSHWNMLMPQAFDRNKADNQILCVTAALARENKQPVILVSNDTNVFLKAAAMGIDVQELKKNEVNTDRLYTGRLNLHVSNEIVQRLRRGCIPVTDIPVELYPNEYLELESDAGMVLAKVVGPFIEEIPETTNHPYGVSPKKNGQKFMWDALYDESIPLVIVTGIAGTGKTFLATAFGLDFINERESMKTGRKFLITRTRTLGEEDPGALPGDLNEKLNPLMAPFFDNMRAIIGENEETENEIDYMIGEGTIEMTSLAYIRGRSIPNAVIVIDEAQNATPGQILEIVTRCAMGTKIIILGDPDQIDNTRLSRRNNGLTFVSERMKDSALAAQITFKDDEAVRSPLAIEAAQKLRL